MKMKLALSVAALALGMGIACPAAEKGEEAEKPESGSGAYIESLGTSLMNTRYCVNPKTKVEVDFAFVAVEKSARIIGAGGATKLYVYCTGGKTIGMGYGDAPVWGQTTIKCDTERHVAVIDYPGRKRSYSTQGKEVWSDAIAEGDVATRTSHMPMALFANMGNTWGTMSETNSNAKVRIYGCRIWDDGKLVHDYRPCVKGGVAGFKDAVDGWFICGEDASQFTASADVETINDDVHLSTKCNDDYGTSSHIDTDDKIGPGTKVVLDAAFLCNGDKQLGIWYLMDSRAEEAPWTTFNLYANPDDCVLCYSCGTSKETKWHKTGFSTKTAKNVRRQITLDAFRGEFAVATGGFVNYSRKIKRTIDKKSQCRLRLAMSYEKNIPHAAALNIYGVKVYEKDKLVRDYVPQTKKGVAGLYDKVSRKFVPSTGRVTVEDEKH